MNFHEDAIVLSGETGTKLKCEILGGYYPTWWGITSGGAVRNYGLSTAIVELNAGTGLDYIEDARETILGSSGHALKLKLENPNASKLKIILVEEDSSCYEHLKNVTGRMWPQLKVKEAEGLFNENKTGVYLLHKNLIQAENDIGSIPLGNSLFFFDPLLFTPWSEIEKVARGRIHSYYRTQTEFIVFLFTSDWFRGRKTINLSPIPKSAEENSWTTDARNSVLKMDDLFGNQDWRPTILTPEEEEKRMNRLVEAYRTRLHKWFRYVLPLPFKPKENQLYHLFMCSNYERGVGITKGFYVKYTSNSPPTYDSAVVYSKFKNIHPETTTGLSGNKRPIQWKFLWTIVRNHDQGLCDIRCQDFREIEEDWKSRLKVLEWLELNGYLKMIPHFTDAWHGIPPLYVLNWDVVTERLDVKPPPALVPLEPKSS